MPFTIADAQAAGWEDDAAAFAKFMCEIDRVLFTACGLDHLCLPDYPFADAFTGGESPEDVARKLLAEEGFFNAEEFF